MIDGEFYVGLLKEMARIKEIIFIATSDA